MKLEHKFGTRHPGRNHYLFGDYLIYPIKIAGYAFLFNNMELRKDGCKFLGIGAQYILNLEIDERPNKTISVDMRRIR